MHNVALNMESQSAPGTCRRCDERSPEVRLLMRPVHAVLCRVLAGLLCLPVISATAIGDEPADESPAKETGALMQRWDSQATLNISRDQIRSVVHDESIIIVQSTAGVVTALNAENGRLLWARQVGQNDAYMMPASISRNHVLIVTGPVVIGLAKFTGDELFAYRLPRQPSLGPTVGDESFFVPFVDGSVGGFSINTLAHLEKFGVLPAGVPKPMAWRFVANESIRQPIVAGTDTVAFATEKGNVHGLHASGTNGGHSLYQLLVRHRMVVPLTVAKTTEDEFLLFATANDLVYCVGLFNGRTMWTYPLGRPVNDPIVVIGDEVYVVTEGDGVARLSLATGRLSATPGGPWHVSGIQSIAAVSATRLYGVDNTMTLIVVDRESSEVVSRIPLGESTNVLSNSLTDRVYLYSPSGRVRCFAEAGSEFATYHQNPDRRPLMPGVPETDPVEPGVGQ